jgi:hypothetical protein
MLLVGTSGSLNVKFIYLDSAEKVAFHIPNELS